MNFLLELEELLKNRRETLPDKSYTANLFRDGIDRILKKVGEEAGELIIAAKNPETQELVHEAADLLFHVQMALVERGLSIKDVVRELERRHKQ
jgi:phosphoribosyl-ATP pyrophosphohydrolase